MRSKIKMWRNGRGGDWSARITWYEGDGSIRLKLDTVDGVQNLYPKNREEANAIWEEFRENNVRPNETSCEKKPDEWWGDVK